MKQTLSFLAVLLMALVLPHSVKAYDFSAVAPSGQTLYYNIITDEVGHAVVVRPGTGSNYDNYVTGNLVIPDEVNYGGSTYTVTSIGNYAFEFCIGLTSVDIPDDVTSIGYQAFKGCTGLTSIDIPDGVTSIGNYAFKGCSGLTSVDIPDGVTSIGNGTFWDCSGLTFVTIPDDVTSIGVSAFEGCSGLTSIDIPAGVTSIGEYAFLGCSGITSIDIPDGVTSISSCAFTGCSGLTSVDIPAGVISIGAGAFSGCTGLTEIHSRASVAPTVSSNSFSNVISTIPIYIPCGSSMSYYSRWSYFSNYFEDDGFSFSATSADDTQGSVSILTQPACQAPTAVFYAVATTGYRFDHWSDGNTENPRTLTLTSDTSLIAYFSQLVYDTVVLHDTTYVEVFVHDTTYITLTDTLWMPGDTVYITLTDTVYIYDTVYIGVDDVEPETAKIYISGGQIVVEGAEGNAVALYDVNGRLLATRQNRYTPLHFDVPASGTYLVRIGDRPARRVVVIR